MTKPRHNPFAVPHHEHGILGHADKINDMRDGLQLPNGHPTHMTPPHPDRLAIKKLPKRF